jgi:hypothetical protein
MRKTFSQSDSSSLIKYVWNLSNIELEQGTYVLSITSKFHQNPTILSEDSPYGKHSANQIAAASLNMHRIC